MDSASACAPAGTMAMLEEPRDHSAPGPVRVPCKATLPAAERLHEAHPEVLFVGIDEDDTTDTARTVVQRFGLTFPVIHDTDNVLSGRFRVSAMPMTFVADGSGVVRWVGGDGQTEDDLRRAVEAAQ